jgi:hypothetical protein
VIQRSLVKQHGHPYSYWYGLLPTARTRTAMNQTKISNRVVVIGRTAPANEKTRYRQLTKQRLNTHRIVVVKNGELVGNKAGR